MSKRFAWSRSPIPGESLLGFIARNADIHAADKMSAVLRAATIETVKPESLPTAHRHKAPELARLFMTTPEEILARTYPPVTLPGRKDGSFFSFFGTPLRSIYLDQYRRRVSPTSLKASDHHRALWDIRPLSFCIESREILLSRCPSCSAEFRWRWTFGCAFCEMCGIDLRNFPQDKIDIDDDEALDFVVGLIHPDSTRKDKARSIAKGGFAANIEVDLGDLFEFVIAVASTIAMGSFGKGLGKIPRVNKVDQFSWMTPDILCKAGRVLIGPNGFERYLEEMRSRSSGARAALGPQAQFGPAALLKSDSFLSPLLRLEIERAVNETVRKRGWKPSLTDRLESAKEGVPFNPERGEVSLFQIALELGIDQQVIARWIKGGFASSKRTTIGRRSFVLVNRDEICALARSWNDAVSAKGVRLRLGVDALAVHGLVSAGFIRRLEGVAKLSMRGGDAYSGSDLTRFVDQIRARAADPRDGMPSQVLSEAVMETYGNRADWARIFSAIFDGRLKISLGSKTEGDRPLVDTLSIEGAHALQTAVPVGELHIRLGQSRLTAGEVAAYLGVQENAVSYFAKCNFLSTNGADKWKFDPRSVDEFKRRYILTHEIERRFRIRSALVRKTLLSMGIHPMNKESTEYFVWPRAEIETAYGA
ncbi:TniQ family protein [Methylosinus sp. Ce-a6]|uniref:TniQ family protein n=1 Tax=Methylosinus sp. Ce-a6 TaxID=2172005 RepID=UPI001359D9B2|nr:TniQ family protein [Methylosinus sp. Ce-a6]